MADKPIQKAKYPAPEEATCERMNVFCCAQSDSTAKGVANEVQVTPVSDQEKLEEKRKQEIEEAKALAKAEDERQARDEAARKALEAADKEKAQKEEAERQKTEEARIAEQKMAEEAKQREMEATIAARPYKDFDVSATPPEGAGLGLRVQTAFPAGAKSIMIVDTSGSCINGDVQAGDTIVGVNGVTGDAAKILGHLESTPSSYRLNIRRVTKNFEVVFIKSGPLGLTVDMESEQMLVKKQPSQGDIEIYNRDCEAGLEIVIGDAILQVNGKPGNPNELLPVMKDTPPGSKLVLLVRRGKGRLPPKPKPQATTAAAPAPPSKVEEEASGDKKPCCSIQ